MKIKEIIEVKIGPGVVNTKLAEGWELLHVVPLPHAVVYVMGMREQVGASSTQEAPKKK